MSKNEVIHPTHFLVPTVLSTPRTKTKGLNFFGSINFGEGLIFLDQKTFRIPQLSVPGSLSIPLVLMKGRRTSEDKSSEGHM